MFVSWCDKVIFFFLCALVFILPASTAGVVTFSYLAILAFIVKKVGAIIIVARASSVKDRRVNCSRAIETPAPVTSVYAALALFVVCMFISVALSQSPSLSVRAFWGKTLPVVMIFFAVQDVMVTEARVRIFLRVILCSAVIVCLDALWQLGFGQDIFKDYTAMGHQLRASFKHPNSLGAYLIPVVVIMAALLADAFFRLKKTGGKGASQAMFWGVLVVAILVLAVMGMTFSRGAWLGMSAAFICLMVFYRSIRLAGGLLIGLFLVVFIPCILSSRGYYIVSGMKSAEVSRTAAESDGSDEVVASAPAVVAAKESILGNTGRSTFWHDGFSILKDYPVFGSGLNTYMDEIKKRVTIWHYYAHNCYLQIAAETGIVGLLSFLALIGSIIAYAVPQIRLLGEDRIGFPAAIFAGWVGLLVQIAFDTTLYSKQLGVYFWILTSLCVAYPFALKSAPFFPGKK